MLKIKLVAVIVVVSSLIIYPQWIYQNSGTNERFMTSYFVNANTGWAAGNDGTILKTTNGGDTWFSQSVATSDNVPLYFL